MKYLSLLFSFLLLLGSTASGQSYDTYFTGNATDLQTVPAGGICLMGGATEDDQAMIWFLQQANGGDILVLRASGSDGYNNYLYSQLGVQVNSVETIVFNQASASSEAYIHQKIQQAEAIWFAGGDQWDYVSYWRNTAIDSLINDALMNRNIVIGGTSAGMAIQGGFYFSAQHGTVTSSTALSNPFDRAVTVDSAAFISNEYLHHVITDTHYDNPDRKGRHLVFLARMLVDYGVDAKGIACDEFTAVCIDTNGIARVFGGYPDYDDNAYFIQLNCELSDVTPENCSPNTPLHWNLGNEAIKVYAVKGTPSGSHTFDLTNWKSGTGGAWENWYIDNGLLKQETGMQPNCVLLSISQEVENASYKIYPNPSADLVIVEWLDMESIPHSLSIINQLGQVKKELNISNTDKMILHVSDLPSGVYFLKILLEDHRESMSKLIIR